MNRNDFLALLNKKLHGLEEKERAQTVSYYCEQLDDRIESGMSEEEAVSQLESPDEIAQKILAMAQNRKASGSGILKTVLLILGAPVWISLLVAAAAVLIAIYVSAWAVVISLAACVLAAGVSAVGGICFSVVFFIQSAPVGLFALGCSFLLAGICLFSLLPVISLIRLSAVYTAKSITYIFTKVFRREGRIL